MDERLPLYQRLRDEIADNIAQQVWRPGELIPTEAELAARHGIAVGTVRKAIDALTAEGLIERQQGRGTFVRRRDLDTSLFRFFRYTDGSTMTTPRSRLLRREVVESPPADARKALQLRSGERAIRLARLRLAEETPFLSEQIWLPHERFAPLLDTPEEAIGDLLYPAYERLCGAVVARAEEELSVGVADADDARLLRLDRGAPIVVVERVAFGFSREPIEWRRTHGAASTFRYKIEIR